MLICLHIPRGYFLEGSVDDPVEFYSVFKFTEARARRNAIRLILPGSAFRGFAVWTPKLDKLRVVAAFNAMTQGDSESVEIAQGAHFGIMQRVCGCCLPSELCGYREPFPRALFGKCLASTTSLAFS